jgi:hypothetical protein
MIDVFLLIDDKIFFINLECKIIEKIDKIIASNSGFFPISNDKL